MRNRGVDALFEQMATIHRPLRVGVEYAELRRLLGDAVAGLHSMVDEHFGISVVEYMAAGVLFCGNCQKMLHICAHVFSPHTGVIPIAHNSGGPAQDIVPTPNGDAGVGTGVQRCGYLCCSVQDYVEAMTRVLLMPQVDRLRMAAEGRKFVAQFSDANFCERFVRAMWPLLQER